MRNQVKQNENKISEIEERVHEETQEVKDDFEIKIHARRQSIASDILRQYKFRGENSYRIIIIVRYRESKSIFIKVSFDPYSHFRKIEGCRPRLGG